MSFAMINDDEDAAAVNTNPDARKQTGVFRLDYNRHGRTVFWDPGPPTTKIKSHAWFAGLSYNGHVLPDTTNIGS